MNDLEYFLKLILGLRIVMGFMTIRIINLRPIERSFRFRKIVEFIAMRHVLWILSRKYHCLTGLR